MNARIFRYIIDSLNLIILSLDKRGVKPPETSCKQHVVITLYRYVYQLVERRVPSHENPSLYYDILHTSLDCTLQYIAQYTRLHTTLYQTSHYTIPHYAMLCYAICHMSCYTVLTAYLYCCTCSSGQQVQGFNKIPTFFVLFFAVTSPVDGFPDKV